MTFPQTLHLLLTSGNHEQNQRTCYKVSSIVYTCVVFLWRNNICKEQLRLCLERVLNSYKLYSISKVRHKGFECWIWWNVTQASVLSVWEWETQSQSLLAQTSVCQSLRAEWPADSWVLDMPKDCSELGRTVQVRNLYLCEWGVPTSHHVKSGWSAKGWVPGGNSDA